MKATRQLGSAGFGSYFRSRSLWICTFLLVMSSFLGLNPLFAQQADQGVITGTVFDPEGKVVTSVLVTVTNTDTGFTVTATTNGSGVYVTPPLSIGHYSVSCAAPGFKTATQRDMMLHVDQRLAANFHLVIGQSSQSVTVSATESLLQTEQSSTGQVISTKMINETPLNQRNYVFIAQLTAGVAPSPGEFRGQGNGDFSANGVSPQQNDFILDGVDNNSSAIDFLNGASYVIKPPPDALAEFKIQTGNYSAALGHSAGAVMNASIKSGTNAFHGDLWEYFRNDALDSRSWNQAPGPMAEYRQNQFGATFGGPILKNRLFFFGDFEANRIIIGNTGILTVPTLIERNGDFSDLLNPALTGSPAVTLYEPGSGGTSPLTYNGKQNVFNPSQINPIAQHILSMFPTPNLGIPGQTYNNFTVNLNQINNTAQWDGRVDWNVNAHDQAFARLSLSNNPTNTPDPFGPVLDGGGYGTDGGSRLKSENLELSETHIFTPSLSNELRFSFEYGAYIFGMATLGHDVSTPLGLGGVPTAAAGGLPWFNVNGYSLFGTTCCLPAEEHENNGELLDNVTKIVGNHALSMGFQLQKIRSQFYISGFPRGWYQYSGLFTSNPGVPFTGFGGADFLADMQSSNNLSIADSVEQYRWYRAGYFQDDWKVTSKLTLNLGLRYDRYDPFSEKKNRQANFVITSASLGTGTAKYEIPNGAVAPIGSTFAAIAAKDNISIVGSSNPRLASQQNLNFAPRIGFAYSATPETVVRGAFGLFYGGLMNGFGTNIGANYPFTLQSNFYSPSCNPGGPCADDGITLKDGFSAQIANGLNNLPVVLPSANAIQSHVKTPYTEGYNLSVQQAFTSTLSATLAYVGTSSHHLQENNIPINAPFALARPGTNMQQYQPFPDMGGITQTAFIASGNYNSLQLTVEKHFGQGLYFLSSYTWAHSLDDEAGIFGTPQNINLLPLSNQYGNSDVDVRQRFTINGNYELPVGAGRRYINHKGFLDELIGGWAIGAMFAAQSGNPFTVFANNGGVAGAPYNFFTLPTRTGDPFKGGGTPNATNPGITCPATVKNRTNWFNPCAFSNPLPGGNIAPGQLITAPSQVIQYLGSGKNQLPGPGYNRVNNSIFKHFATYKEQYLEFRADIFNTLNHPTWSLPPGSYEPINSNAGEITGPQSLGANSPDGRFIQLALKYVF